MIHTVGSVCSGIEAASVAWAPLGLRFSWFSEIAPFPSGVLAKHYPAVPNLGDMNGLPPLLARGEAGAPDLICGGTPCQAFSLAGWQNGLNDGRGDLTLRFVDIVQANDLARLASGRERCRVFWENVEGVLTDRTNVFGRFLSSLAGLRETLSVQGGRWPNAGVLRGPVRNIAWRVLDAKYFGLPQQRRRLYVIAGGTDFFPENVLFEPHEGGFAPPPAAPLSFEKDGHRFQVFRAYTDCLYSAYGTKWNGNAAAYNGSLFVVQDGRIRRLSPLEAERLMGFPDRYTDMKGARKTSRYQALGNSWAVPVVRWLGSRLLRAGGAPSLIPERAFQAGRYLPLGREHLALLENGVVLNCSSVPERCAPSSMRDIVSPDAPEDIYISPVGCYGILRRAAERRMNIDPSLAEVLRAISAQMPPEAIEEKSRVQKRGRFSLPRMVRAEPELSGEEDQQLAFFDPAP